MATFGDVTIGTTAYTGAIYGTLAGATTYLNAAAHAVDAWTAAGLAADSSQERALVTATRMLDRQAWAGDKVDAAQAHAWPRVGVSGVAVDAIPADIVTACYELAAAILGDAAGVQGLAGTASAIQSAGAGGASVTFFSPTTGTRFPDIVQELLAPYLSSAGSDLGVGFVATGTCVDSQFDRSDTYRLRRG